MPSVGEIVQRIREPLSDSEKAALDAHLATAVDDAERYQQAFQWLGIRRNPAYRDRVIQLTTLAACDRSGIEETHLLSVAGTLELESDRWSLPDGQAALGRLLTGLPPRLRGPVLTTNFDPLTEIAVRKAGSDPTIFVNADDTSFLANLRVQTNPFVLHLHGYWRDSTTLSTPEQLELSRPVLEASLRFILERYTLVVVGYGGWSDVVTRIIQEQITSQQVDSLDILWTFFQKDEKVRELVASHPTLSALSMAPGNVQFYTDVNANVFLPALERAIAEVLEYPDSPRPTVGQGGPVGWTAVTIDYLERWRVDASVPSALAFFDGRVPSWADAVSPHVPLRAAAVELSSSLRKSVSDREITVDLVVGASGEGKTTIALQMASLVARDGFAKVLVLDSDYLTSDAAILQLPANESYVLVVDEAYRFAARIQELVTRARSEGRKRLHFVLVTRDTDWQSAGGNMFAWSRQVTYREHRVNGLTRQDAVSMVRIWERMGDDALGELAEYQNSEERVAALLSAAQGLGLRGRGTLLGALLSTRIGSGLRDHIAALMSRLRSRLLAPHEGETTLLDALVLIALPYAYEVLDLEPAVLADALRLQWPDLVTSVLTPLGEEAAITYTSGRVVIRHEMIASAILDVCLEWDYNLESAISVLVAAAARRLERGGYAPRTGSIAYIASQISDLPQLSIAAAQSAVSAVPARLSYRTHLSAALRRNSQASMASELNADALPLLGNAINSGQCRPFFTEWGVVEGNLGNWARNALLVGWSLQDSPSLGPIYADKTARAVACLLLAVRKLAEADQSGDLVEAVAAVSVISRALGSPESLAWLREAERFVDRRNVRFPDPRDSASLVRSLKKVMSHARQNLESPLPSGMPHATWNFEGLVRLLA